MWKLLRLNSGLRVFRILGVDVCVHWSWLLALPLCVPFRNQIAQTTPWIVADAAALFVLVLLHEFGHALACKSVGGTARRIVLWPLGGLAFVTPPQRPWAVIWCMAAGPLVNLAIVPLTLAAFYLGQSFEVSHDLMAFIEFVVIVNLLLLAFNLLPFYPLDGGQILRGLLWLAFGRVPSLLVASAIGLFVGVVVLVLAAAFWNFWLFVTALFGAMQACTGMLQAWRLRRILSGPRRPGFVCPNCRREPPVGDHWRCEKCAHRLDAFVDRFACPKCADPNRTIPCIDCGMKAPPEEWPALPPLPPVPVFMGAAAQAVAIKGRE
ncbi:MAG: hypothetical protein JWO87_61 [Phycisphaerales bacterium]|nr:hypothetical protein [Phycisphaerales bacterium]